MVDLEENKGFLAGNKVFFVFFLLYLMLGMRTRRIGKDKGLFKKARPWLEGG